MKNRSGFTLIELLIVVAIIAILAAAVFVALNPLKRFQDARDSRRKTDVEAILDAIVVHQVDNGGYYLTAVSSTVADDVYMIVNGSSMAAGCDDHDLECDTNVQSDTHCIDLSPLVTQGYLGSIPFSPQGEVAWDDATSAGNEGTGYTLERNTAGTVTIRACESENTTEIFATR